jgi:hypothetical protein
MTTQEKIEKLGWFWDLHIAGGWSHMDVRDDDGKRLAFDTPHDVVLWLGISEEEG